VVRAEQELRHLFLVLLSLTQAAALGQRPTRLVQQAALVAAEPAVVEVLMPVETEPLILAAAVAAALL
jgi:hypothetical protein